MTESIGISFVSKAAEYLVGPVIRHARYLICFNHFVRDVDTAKCELESTLRGVKERQEEAAQRTEKITEMVKTWINNVEKMLQEVHKLQEKADAARNKCFHFPFRYSLAKEMDKKKEQMVNLNGNNKFEPFSYPTKLPAIHYFSTKDFVLFDSTKSTYDKLLEAIKDNNNNIIGLYGIGGSGKTTLAKEVGKNVGELFDKVVVAVVSQPPNVINIQDQIADQIGLQLKEQSNLGRAQRLSTRLQNGRHLIILDDVWGILDLEDIGIPSKSIDNKGCCVLLTTRLRQMCRFMNCQKIIELPLLTEEEAQVLFNQRANISNNSSNELKPVAEDIVSECKGLPLAIVIVGTTLRGKGLEEWRAALSRLKHSQPMDIEEDLRGPYACLVLSFNNLKSQVAKSLFLLCSMFPEDHDIHKEDLVRFGMGVLELTANVDTIEDIRGEIYTAINVLLDSCLLMSSTEKDCVKMHDLVRDVALWVARKQGQAIMVARKEVPILLAENENVKDTEVISLWDLKEDFKLSDQLQCPTLKILLLHSEDSFVEPYPLYAGGMKALKVLALIRFCFEWDNSCDYDTSWAMPRSIELLTNLRTLCLRGNNLGDISNLGNLKGLEILDLRGCSFMELPVGIVNMKKLKLLDLGGCFIEKSPYEVIGRCTQLQELYVWVRSKCPVNVSFPRLQRYVICVFFEDASMSFEDDSDQIGASMPSEDEEDMFSDNEEVGKHEEVEASRALASMPFKDNSDQSDASMLSEDVDMHFHIFRKFFEGSRALHIEGGTCSTLNSSLKDLFVRANNLWLHQCRWEGYREEPSSKVKELWLTNCPDIKILVDISNVGILQGQEEHLKLNSNLSILCLSELPKLEYIWKGPAQILSLHRLKYVSINKCSKLKTIFTPTVYTGLPNLMELDVSECKKLEEIVSIDSEQLTSLHASASTYSNINVCFPKLSKISILKCNKLKCLFSYSLASQCPSLSKLKIHDCSELEQLVGRDEGGGHEAGVLFPKLTMLKLKTLLKLTQIFPGFKYDKSLHHIKKCPSILLE